MAWRFFGLGMRRAILVMASVAMAVFLTAPAFSQAVQTWDLDLPSQSLRQTLIDLADETGANIVAPSDLVGDITAPAISGRYSVEEAIRRAIDGTGLRFRTAASGAVVLERGIAQVKDTRHSLTPFFNHSLHPHSHLIPLEGLG